MRSSEFGCAREDDEKKEAMKGWGLSSSLKGPALLVPVGCREVELQSQPANDSQNILVSFLIPSRYISSLFSLPCLVCPARGGRSRKSSPFTFCVNSSATIFAVTLWPAGRVSRQLLTFSLFRPFRILSSHQRKEKSWKIPRQS